jgi:hypothetical protein
MARIRGIIAYEVGTFVPDADISRSAAFSGAIHMGIKSFCCPKPITQPTNLQFLGLRHQGSAVAWAAHLHLSLAAKKQLCLYTHAHSMTRVQPQKTCAHCRLESIFAKHANES